MAYDISSLTQRVLQFEPRAKVLFSEEFSALHTDHRSRIRRSIAKTLQTGPNVLDLSTPPRLKDWSVSISHCDYLGGWIAVPRPLKVGLDIELKERINPKLVDRISQSGELTGIPDPAFLWCAKESYFKALEDEQPTAVTQLRIEKWSQSSAGGWQFSSSGLRGSMFSAVDLLVSVSLI